MATLRALAAAAAVSVASALAAFVRRAYRWRCDEARDVAGESSDAVGAGVASRDAYDAAAEAAEAAEPPKPRDAAKLAELRERPSSALKFDERAERVYEECADDRYGLRDIASACLFVCLLACSPTRASARRLSCSICSRRAFAQTHARARTNTRARSRTHTQHAADTRRAASVGVAATRTFWLAAAETDCVTGSCG